MNLVDRGAIEKRTQRPGEEILPIGCHGICEGDQGYDAKAARLSCSSGWTFGSLVSEWEA